MQDPYDLLGVQRTDTEDTIRKAYRKLAKKHHPDLNPGKPEAAERFKEISVAYALLTDTEKRARFDRGEIDIEGHEKAPASSTYGRRRPQADPARPYGNRADYATNFNFDDLEGLFGGSFSEQGFSPNRPRQGASVQYSLTIPFLDAVRGTVRRLSLSEGRTLDVTIPPGLQDGHVLRLRGQGAPGSGGGAAGDALVEISVAAHPFFTREGDDIVVRLPITLQEAVLGAAVDVPTVAGQVRLTVPPNAANGTRLRLKGRGIGEGHQYVELAVVLPTQTDQALAAFLKDWKPEHPQQPREDMVLT